MRLTLIALCVMICLTLLGCNYRVNVEPNDPPLSPFETHNQWIGVLNSTIQGFPDGGIEVVNTFVSPEDQDITRQVLDDIESSGRIQTVEINNVTPLENQEDVVIGDAVWGISANTYCSTTELTLINNEWKVTGWTWKPC